MGSSLSVFLNILRVICALVIALGGLSSAGFLPSVPFDGSWAHFAVVVFFVISGYCVAHTRHTRHATLAHYGVARLSRIYSILFPALILTAVLYFLGSLINPAYYAPYGNDTQPWSMVLTLFNVQELWFSMEVPLSNTPLWMLSYLVGFYALYGAMTYLRGALRVVWVGLICLWMGPKVLLLLPCWLVGMMAYAVQPYVRWGRDVAGAVLVMSLTLLLGFSIFITPQPGAFGAGELRYSNAFATDIIHSFFIGFIILALKEIFFTFGDRATNLAARTGAITFSIFAIHQPIFIFLAAILPSDIRESVAGSVIAFALVLTAAISFSHFAATRDLWAKLFAKVFNPPQPKATV